VRRLVLFAIAVCVGCAYPEFTFARDSGKLADTLEDVVAPDTALPDTPIDTFAPPPDTATPPDTTVADTRPETLPDVAPEVPISTGCIGSTARYCFDWDKSTTPSSGWTFDGVSPTGSLSLDVSGGRSSPNALLATASPGSVNVVVANMSKVFTAPTADTLLKVDGWIKLETDKFPTTGGGAAFLFKLQRNAGDGDGVTFGLDGAGFYADRIGVTYDWWAIPTKPKIGVWMHVRIHARLLSTGGNLTIWIDDMATAALSKSGISTARMDDSAKQVIVGLYADRSSSTFRVRYDDVEINF